MELSEVRAIITGAAGGMGRHFVRRLLQAGASVVACDVDEPGLRTLYCTTQEISKRLLIHRADISQEESIEQLIDQAFRWCPCNVLVNNAGILRDGLLIKRESGSTRKLPLIQWQQVQNVNLTGPYLAAREFAAALSWSRGSGVVVNISSIAGSGNVGQSAYAASKAALDSCTRTWAMDLKEMKIRVVGIAPGVIETPMLRRISDDVIAQLRSRIPLGRFGTPEDVWVALRFVLECEFFNGRVLQVDGGGSFL